jgi:hypothetical protein
MAAATDALFSSGNRWWMADTTVVDFPSASLSVQVVPATGAKITAEVWIAPEFQATGSRGDPAGLEFGLHTERVSGKPLEGVASQHINSIASTELISRTIRTDETSIEAVAKQVGGAGSAPALESLTDGALISIDTLLALEWVDPPAPIVSSGRALRSSGKIRILAGPGNVHPLRGQ